MTIRDYIKKRGLTPWRTRPVAFIKLIEDSIPALFTEADAGHGEFDHADKFEIYADADRTHFVSLNTTRDLFRIVHYDLIIFYSKWESMRPGLDYRELPKL